MINVLLNIALFIFKVIGGRLSHSVSVMADAFNNLSDAGTTLAAWLGIKIASLGPGEHHPNGHGRFEWIVALLSASSVIIIGWELLKDSIEAVSQPGTSVFSIFTVVVLIVSIGVKGFMYLYNSKQGKEKDSESYKAIAADSLSDAVATLAVLGSLIFYRVTGKNIDGWCGLIVSIFIIYNGFKSFIETTARIMGGAPSKEELEAMKQFVMRNQDFQEVFDLQIEDYGYGRHRVSMIIVGKADQSGDQLISDAAETTGAIYKQFGYNVLISIEKPILDEHEEEIRKQVGQMIESAQTQAKLLGFRLSSAGKRKMLRLEIGVPHEQYGKLEEVDKYIQGRLTELPPDYIAIPKVRLMRDYDRFRRHNPAEREKNAQGKA